MTPEQRLQAARQTFEQLHKLLRTVLPELEPNRASQIGTYLIEMQAALGTELHGHR